MQSAMASEVNVLGHLLNRLSESHRWYRDFTVNALTAAVRETIACFRVYRTYLLPGDPPTDADTRVILRALAEARRRNPALERTVFEFLRDVLLPPEPNPHPVDEALRREFVLKFQQCTSPIAAKGVEDTAFYQYHRLVALNEVGGEPGDFGTTVETFHRQNAARLAEFPHSMLATSTHDTKRSEDVRARLAALSEISREWAQALRRWHTINHRQASEIDGESAPDHNEEALLYQTLLGSWPLEPLDDPARAVYVQRIQDYMVKALHEAKVNSSWVEPNEAWDKAVGEFVARILDPVQGKRFLATFEPLAGRLAQLGAINSLSQTVLKLTAPGVPDIYQGAELWDLSLVDPDNRRPVDYALRRDRLAARLRRAIASDLPRRMARRPAQDVRHPPIAAFSPAIPETLRRGRLHPGDHQRSAGRMRRGVHPHHRRSDTARRRPAPHRARRITADRRLLEGHGHRNTGIPIHGSISSPARSIQPAARSPCGRKFWLHFPVAVLVSR